MADDPARSGFTEYPKSFVWTASAPAPRKTDFVVEGNSLIGEEISDLTVWFGYGDGEIIGSCFLNKGNLDPATCTVPRWR